MKFELRRWKEKYIGELQRAADDTDIAKWMDDGFASPFTGEDAAKFITARLCADDEREYSRAVIIDGEVCGGIQLVRGEGIYSCGARLTFWLSVQHQNKGIMTDALREFIAEVHEQYDLVRLCAMPFADNTAARCVLNNCGFELECTLKKAAQKNGSTHDVCVYSIID